MAEKNLYIIAGCNGAGKTTASYTILPEMLHCDEFVNEDEIAKGLSPFNPEGVALEAGRIMLNRINELIDNGKSFAFETTLATRSYRNKIFEARKKGYSILLLFLWLRNTEMANDRVRTRVAKGGHNIKFDVIERRYRKGLQNLFDLYLPIVDLAVIYDNSDGLYEMVSYKGIKGDWNIVNDLKSNEIKSSYHDCSRTK